MAQDPGPKVIPVTKDGREGVQVVGSKLTVGGTPYDFDGPRTIYGLAANRPTVAAAEAAVGGTAYYSCTDTQGVVYQTDGTNWQAV